MSAHARQARLFGVLRGYLEKPSRCFHKSSEKARFTVRSRLPHMRAVLKVILQNLRS